MKNFNILHFSCGEVAKYSILERIVFIILFFVLLLITFFLTQIATQLLIEKNQTIEETVLIEGVVGIPITINPVFAKAQIEKDLSYLVYSSLLRKDTNGKINGDLATNWQTNEDGGYTFNINTEAVFTMDYRLQQKM